MSPFFACYGKDPRTPMAAVIERAKETEPHDNDKFYLLTSSLLQSRHW